jgi:hypothetical protein
VRPLRRTRRRVGPVSPTATNFTRVDSTGARRRRSSSRYSPHQRRRDDAVSPPRPCRASGSA